MSRFRRELQEYAERVGFGQVVRLHVEVRMPALALALLVLTSLGTVIGALAIFGYALAGSSSWRFVALGWIALVWLVIVLSRSGPGARPDSLTRIATTPGGLVIRSATTRTTPRTSDRATGSGAPVPEVRATGGEPVAIGWHELRHQRIGPIDKVSWTDIAGEHVLSLSGLVGRRDLVRAVDARRPVPPWSARRIVAVGVLGLATAVIAVVAGVPVGLDLLLGERPGDIAAFARLCRGGDGFGRASGYEGRAPHPVAVYDAELASAGDIDPDDYRGVRPNSTGWPGPERIQLVGCEHPTGHASSTKLAICDYQPELGSTGHGYEETWYQGRYRIDLYDARTGRAVGSVTLDGDPRHTCALRTVTGADVKAKTYDTSPRDRDFAKVLTPWVDGRAK